MTDVIFTAIDHIQLAMPMGGEETVLFYIEALRMIELPKPHELAKRGGCWFPSGTVQAHLGVEHDFRPANKAHPAPVAVTTKPAFLYLRGAGVDSSEVDDIPGVRRCHIHDPFGNRIELIAA